MTFTAAVRCCWLVLAALLIGAPVLSAADGEFLPAFSIGDVDLQHSAVIGQDQRVPLDADLFRAHLQARSSKQAKAEVRTSEGWQMLLVFRQPLPLGTALLGACGSESSHFMAQVLRSDFSGDTHTAQPVDWQTIGSTHEFPAEFRTRAIRLIGTREYRGPLTWLLSKARLANLTAAAVGIGERAPFGAHPDSLPRGQEWFNTGKDTRPGAARQLQRGAVSEALPSWYILAWDTPQSLDGLWLSSNADEFRLLAYRGEEGLNPAVAPASAWKRIEFETQHEQPGGGGDRLNDRLLTFPTLKMTALKLEMTSCQRGPVARISHLAAIVDAQHRVDNKASIVESVKGNDPGPLPHGRGSFGGKAISFEQPFDGQLAMVIMDAEGRTIRNLVAQVDRKQGPNVEFWDLKDDAGLTVGLGTYRWMAITSPPLGLRYQMTVYPNVPQLFPGQTPWLTGESGANGWLADHAPITSGTVCGDHVYFGAPGVEGGVCLIECDLNGRKQWGKHSFGPFSGVGRLAADKHHIYIQERDSLHRLDPETHTIERLAALSSVERQGTITGMAAHEGQVAVALSSPVPWFENATRPEIVDLENSLPKFAAKIADPLGNRRVQPNPRLDFLRLLRLTGTPAGQGPVAANRREAIFPITIDTSGVDGKYQYVVLAFQEAVPLGSVVLPSVGAEYLVDMSVLKPDAPYPPDPRQDNHWLPCPEQPKPGWTCVPMPPQTRTRGLRLRVRLAKEAGETDIIDDVLAEKKPRKGTLDIDIDLDRGPKSASGKSSLEEKPADNWFARFEGMKLLRRRFTSLNSQAQVRVNSGTVNARGEWDAERTESLSPEKPAIYVQEWPTNQNIAGLAIKEIDGAVTEIDVWEGEASDGEIPLTDAPGWRHVATYNQSRRDAYEPAYERNDSARYLDGYVAFGREVSTRAVRLRVVSQWADNTDRGTASLRQDLGGRSLDPRRCRIWGVAALEYLGDEPPLDTLAWQRLEVRDGQTGKVIREVTVEPASPSSLAFGPDGALFGVQQGRVIRIDTTTGAAKHELPEIDGKALSAQCLTVGADGSFYVYVLPERVVRVYDSKGKQLRTIGHPGGQTIGPWDPEKFQQVETLFADHKGQLWVVESQDMPRRIVQFGADGGLLREFLGNTHYGGAGVLDPADKSRLFCNHLEFAIDWETGRSRIRNMLANWLPADLVPVRYKGQTYLTSTPLSHQATGQVAVLYRYDESRGTATLAAAFGEANAFDPLKVPRILTRLEAGKVARDYTFLWSDTNSDSQVDPDEVTFELKSPESQSVRVGRFNDQLRCWAGSQVYQPREVLPNGVPVFEKLASPAPRAGTFEWDNGDLLALSAPSDRPVRYGEGRAQETRGISRDGQIRWRYPTEHSGVSGLWLPPWEAGYVSNEFGVIGHATARAGDLGEFVVVHGNNGQWKIWTADGFLAGQILRHKFDPRSIVESSLPNAERGMSLDNLTAGQEHFHGYFTQTPDGRSYIVHGGNYIIVSEVVGLDRFQRLAGEVIVSAEDVRRVREHHEELARREARSHARLLDCLRVKDGQVPDVAEQDGVKFGIGYDEKNLYVRWNVVGHGRLSNSGTDFHRYFKTGACLDLQLGVDEGANAGRRAPVAGDLRLLFTVAEGKPQAVLYQPVADDAAPGEAWEAHTEAGGTTRFDRVVRLTETILQHTQHPGDQYSFSAAIPLKALGWKPVDAQLLSCDWGVMTSDEGHTVKRRIYWSNSLATGTTDEAWEARLEPHLWGTLAVITSSRAEQQLERASPDAKTKNSSAVDLLDDIESKNK